MEISRKKLVEKLINVYVNHEIYKEGNETALETLNRYRWTLKDLDLLPEEVDEAVIENVRELMKK